MRRTLFDISDDLIVLADLLTEAEGEIPESVAGAVLEKWFDQLGDERDRKLDHYCALIRELEAAAAARVAEADRLQALASVDHQTAKRLRERLKSFFEIHRLSKLDTTRFKLWLQADGGKAPLVVPGSWVDQPATAPERYHRRRIELDKSAIRADLEVGQEIPGCYLGEKGTHLRIK